MLLTAFPAFVLGPLALFSLAWLAPWIAGEAPEDRSSLRWQFAQLALPTSFALVAVSGAALWLARSNLDRLDRSALHHGDGGLADHDRSAVARSGSGGRSFRGGCRFEGGGGAATWPFARLTVAPGRIALRVPLIAPIDLGPGDIEAIRLYRSLLSFPCSGIHVQARPLRASFYFVTLDVGPALTALREAGFEVRA